MVSPEDSQVVRFSGAPTLQLRLVKPFQGGGLSVTDMVGDFRRLAEPRYLYMVFLCFRYESTKHMGNGSEKLGARKL